MNYTGGFFNLLNPYALVGGLTLLSLSVLEGALFLNLKTSGVVQVNAKALSSKLWIPVLALAVVFIAWTLVLSAQAAIFWLAILFAVLAVASALAGFVSSKTAKDGRAFGFMVAAIAFSIAMLFAALFPNVMVSSTDPAWSLTLVNAASSKNTLTVMAVVAAIFLPVVLAYQAWNYWIFRKRITSKVEDLHY